MKRLGGLGRVAAGSLQPDVLVAVDVNHDYEAAPNMNSKRFPKLTMGNGFTITKGSITSPAINGMLESVAKEEGIPFQLDVRERHGHRWYGWVSSVVDAASASIGFPIRNMHTISECGHTGDVLAAVHVLNALVERLECEGVRANDPEMHPRLDLAVPRECQASEDNADGVDNADNSKRTLEQ